MIDMSTESEGKKQQH